MPLRVLIVEDEPRVRHFLEDALRQEGCAVDGCARGDDALERALRDEHDVILLDLSLPGRSGLDLLRSLRGLGRRTPVLIVTARDRLEDRIIGLDAGADDYLTKPFALPELLARMRAVLRRGKAEAPVLQIEDLRIELVTRRVQRGSVAIELTPKEFKLLAYLAHFRNDVVTRTMIAEHVWEMPYDAMANVIEVYVRILRRKIDEPFARKLIHTHRGIGYSLGALP